LRWIEEAEERAVLAPALFERATPLSWCRAARQFVCRQFNWLLQGSGLALRSPRLPTPPAPPVPVARPAPRDGGRYPEDDGYSSCW